MDMNLFKQNLTRLRAHLENAELIRQNSQSKNNRDLRDSIQGAKEKADWLLSEIEIAEGEELLAKAGS